MHLIPSRNSQTRTREARKRSQDRMTATRAAGATTKVNGPQAPHTTTQPPSAAALSCVLPGHGKADGLESFITNARPSVLMRVPSLRRKTSMGIPRTEKRLDSASLACGVDGASAVGATQCQSRQALPPPPPNARRSRGTASPSRASRPSSACTDPRPGRSTQRQLQGSRPRPCEPCTTPRAWA